MAAEQQCLPKDIKLQVLGAGGPELSDGLASSSYLIWIKGKARVLVEAGPGSSVNYDRADAEFADLQSILLTHLHVDHSADLPAYIKGAFFTSREEDLLVFGPEKNALMPSTSEFITRLIGPQGAFPYLADHLWQNDEQSGFQIKGIDVPIQSDVIQRYTVSDQISVSAIRTEHGPVASIAWRVDALGCGITFSGDMSNNAKTLAKLADKSKILVMHNAIPEEASGIARNLHMPPSEMGKIAHEAQVDKVIVSHFMGRTVTKKNHTQRHMLKYYSGPIILAHEMAKYTIQ